MVDMNYKDPTVQEKREIRKELEKFNLQELLSGQHIIPTDLAELICRYCYSVNEDAFYSIGEGSISEMCGNALTKLFVGDEKQKKS